MGLRAIRNNVDTDMSVSEYPDFLSKFGDGKLKKRDSFIDLPTSVNIRRSAIDFVRSVSRNLDLKYNDVQWLKSRGILTPTNCRLQILNNQFQNSFQEHFRTTKLQTLRYAIQ